MSVSAFHFLCSRVSALASGKQQPKQPSAEARAASARLSVQQQLNRALADLNGALESVRVISREIMPRAGVVVTNSEARYKLGDASLADILQKRRDWNATQTSYLHSLREVHDAGVRSQRCRHR